MARKISDENFACSRQNGDIRVIDIQGKEHRVPVNGSVGRIPVNDSDIVWYCGNSEENWSPPRGTDFINVSRKESGAGTVEYYAN